MKAFDLSFPYEDGMPYFEGDPEPSVEQFKEYERDGYRIKKLVLGTHTGTHIDAPAHFIKDGKTVDQLDPLDLSGDGTCLQYDPEKGLDLPEEHYKILLLFTGYNLGWGKFKKFKDFSYINEQDAEALKSYGVRLVGIDSPSAERSGSTNFQTHKILLGSSIPIVENLNSFALQNLLNRKFNVFIFPMLVKNGDGAPTRVIAAGDWK